MERIHRQSLSTQEDIIISWKESRSKYEIYSHQLNERLQNLKFQHDFQQTKQALHTIDRLRQLYYQRRIIENSMGIITLLGIGIVLLEFDYLIEFWLNFVGAIGLLAGIGYRTFLQHQMDISHEIIPISLSLFQRPMVLGKMIVEMMICIIIPPPIEQTFTISEWRSFVDSRGQCPDQYEQWKNSCYLQYNYSYRIIGLFMLLRLYMIPRWIRNQTGFYSHRIAFVGTINNVDSLGSMFAVKCFLRSKPFHLLLPGVLLTLFITAYTVMVLERPVNPALDSLSNTLWLTIITMSTIGYGDLFPLTYLGRLVMVFGGMFMGILLISILTASFFGLIELTSNDHRVLDVLHEEQWLRQMNTACASLIQHVWHLRHCTPNTIRYQQTQQKLFLSAMKVKSLRRRKPLQNPSVDHILSDIYPEMTTKLQQHHQQKLERLQRCLEQLQALT